MNSSDTKYHNVESVTLEVSDISILEQLLTGHSNASLFPTSQEIKMNLRELSERENTDWQVKLNRYYKPCGCPQGSLFIFISVFCYIIFLFVRPSH